MLVNTRNFNYFNLSKYAKDIKENNYDEKQLLQFYIIKIKEHQKEQKNENEEIRKKIIKHLKYNPPFSEHQEKRIARHFYWNYEKSRPRFITYNPEKLISLIKSFIYLDPKQFYYEYNLYGDKLTIKHGIEYGDDFIFAGTGIKRSYKEILENNTSCINELKKAIQRMNDKPKQILAQKEDKENEKRELEDFKNSRIKIEEYYNTAISFITKEDFPKAIYNYSEAILLDKYCKSELDLFFGRGKTKFELMDYLGCIKDIEKSIFLKGETTKKALLCGITRFKLKNYKEAIEDLMGVIKIDSRNSKAYYYRGLCNIELQNKSEGCLDLSKAGELGYFEAYHEIKKNCN